MGKGSFIVSYEMLGQSLHLPIDTQILAVVPVDFPPRAFAVEAEHPGIPENIPEKLKWCGAHQLNPTFETDYDGGKTEYAIKFVSWR